MEIRITSPLHPILQNSITPPLRRLMALYPQFKYLPAGDSAVMIEVGDAIDPDINRIVRGLMLALQAHPIAGMREAIPTYRSVLVMYDPVHVLFHELVEQLQEREAHLAAVDIPEPRIIEIPVVYGGEDGPDLGVVAQHAHLSPEEVIALHSEPEYLVYMLGFTPGFCYLGGMDDRLETPRLKEPRTNIPAGSVGIAGKQTGVYPIDSPGGWQLIGKTPLRLFDLHRSPPVLVQAGDVVRFVPLEPETTTE
jgi:inhibitor of KinA